MFSPRFFRPFRPGPHFFAVGQTWKSDKHGFTPPHLPVFLCFACTPSHLLVFCVLYAVRAASIMRAYCKHHAYTAVRALTDPASLSKDASVSNEDLQEIALEAQVNSLFDGSSDSDSEARGACPREHQGSTKRAAEGRLFFGYFFSLSARSHRRGRRS
jgi:hypothetical protein